MSVTLGSANTPTAFTLQDYGPGYTTLISKTTMTGLPMGITLTLSGSTVTSVSTAIATGGMSIYDVATSQTYSVSLLRLYDSYALSSGTTGTATTITMNGIFNESWHSAMGNETMSATFNNFQLVIAPGASSADVTEDLSVTGSLNIIFNPAVCQNGNFTFVTNTPIVFNDTLGYSTAGEVTINGATTVVYNDDGSITVTTNGTSQTFPNEYDLTQVCPIATLGQPATLR